MPPQLEQDPARRHRLRIPFREAGVPVIREPASRVDAPENSGLRPLDSGLSGGFAEETRLHFD